VLRVGGVPGLTVDVIAKGLFKINQEQLDNTLKIGVCDCCFGQSLQESFSIQ